MSSEARTLMDELKKERPKDTLLNQLWFPTSRAAIELQNGREKEAVEELEIAERYEKAGEFYPQMRESLINGGLRGYLFGAIIRGLCPSIC